MLSFYGERLSLWRCVDQNKHKSNEGLEGENGKSQVLLKIQMMLQAA